MNKEQLTERIEQSKADQCRLKEEQDKLENKLAELDKVEEKPEKLFEYRDGDYGLCCGGYKALFFFVVGDGQKAKVHLSDGTTETWTNIDNTGYHEATLLGNIFDDIAKSGEELEKFEAKNLEDGRGFYGCEVKAMSRFIRFNDHHHSGEIDVSLDQAQEICDNLQKVINFANNKDGKK